MASLGEPARQEFLRSAVGTGRVDVPDPGRVGSVQHRERPGLQASHAAVRQILLTVTGDIGRAAQRGEPQPDPGDHRSPGPERRRGHMNPAPMVADRGYHRTGRPCPRHYAGGGRLLLTAGDGLGALQTGPCPGLSCAASCSSRSAVPWRRACHSPCSANSPLGTGGSFLRRRHKALGGVRRVTAVARTASRSAPLPAVLAASRQRSSTEDRNPPPPFSACAPDPRTPRRLRCRRKPGQGMRPAKAADLAPAEGPGGAGTSRSWLAGNPSAPRRRVQGVRIEPGRSAAGHQSACRRGLSARLGVGYRRPGMAQPASLSPETGGFYAL
jgi:hypothetical protein